jgi:hypothetical protein
MRVGVGPGFGAGPGERADALLVLGDAATTKPAKKAPSVSCFILINPFRA